MSIPILAGLFAHKTEESTTQRIALRHQDYSVPSRFPAKKSKVISGYRAILIHILVWSNVLGVCLFKLGLRKNSFRAYRSLLGKYRLYRNKNYVVRYASVKDGYQFNLNTPIWPSAAFNRFIRQQIQKVTEVNQPCIQTLVLAITKKCGFQCAHCVEWNQLNKPESLTRHQLLKIIQQFHACGTTQVQLSGGEPMNRLKDILFLLRKAPRDIDIWSYTNGYSLNREKCNKLRAAGLKGVIISIDQHSPEGHDQFRGVQGSWIRAATALRAAFEAGLSVGVSCCVTREYCSSENLLALATLAGAQGASFLQLLEPSAEGHFEGKDVLLRRNEIRTLEEFYTTMMHTRAGEKYPIVTYHAYHSRRLGCVGSGNQFLYVDTDGMVQSCPFCREKWFSALQDDIRQNLLALQSIGCKNQTM